MLSAFFHYSIKVEMAAHRPFMLERYFAEYEFNTKYLLCCSDPEALLMKDLVEMADDECRSEWENLSLCYTESKGHPTLRREVANMYDNIDPDDVLVYVPNEAIFVAMKCLPSYVSDVSSIQDVHVIVTFPTYQSLYENLRAAQCELSYWRVDFTENGWHFDVDKLESMITKDTKILVVNFPHNPTGFVPSLSEWMRIIDICKKNNIVLFSDEMYRLSNHDGSVPLPSASSLYDNAISLSGLSKTFGLPGLRIGWLCSKNTELMKMCEAFKDYTTICSPAPCEILSIIALRNKTKIIHNTVVLMQNNLDILESFFNEYPHLFEWHRPSACTTGFLKLKGKALEVADGGATGFCKFILDKSQVLLLPGAKYEFDDIYVRVGYGRKNLPEAVEALRKGVKQLMNN